MFGCETVIYTPKYFDYDFGYIAVLYLWISQFYPGMELILANFANSCDKGKIYKKVAGKSW